MNLHLASSELFSRLDRESVPFYELTAYAVDRGVPPQRTPVHIQVTVLDVNDNAPVFPADDFEVLVKENSAVGSVVAQITATDPDEGATRSDHVPNRGGQHP